MSTGGIFNLITNDGRQDRMLMASDLLKTRIESIKETRDVTLNDIEQTHILFTNAHFKPFAAIGFEYNKITPQNAPNFGSKQVQFSIPQFGDFFHDMVLHTIIPQPTLTTTSTPAARMRWCDFPGERLLSLVSFTVNGNPLDQYDSTVYNMYREFQVAPHKKTGWYRCIGQELPVHGFLDEYVSDTRVQSEMCNGNQTPSSQKTAPLELFVPLLFWFNKDARLSIPSVAIPYGQRFIYMDIAEQSLMVNIVPGEVDGTGSPKWASSSDTLLAKGSFDRFELYINNIFMNPEIHDIFIKRVGFSLIRVHRIQITTVNSSATTPVLLNNLKWPIETMFVGFRMNSLGGTTTSTAAEVAKYMDTWYKFCDVSKTQTRVSSAGSEVAVGYLGATSSLSAVLPSPLGTPITLTVQQPTTGTAPTLAEGDRVVLYSRCSPVSTSALAQPGVAGSPINDPVTYTFSASDPYVEFTRLLVVSVSVPAMAGPPVITVVLDPKFAASWAQKNPTASVFRLDSLCPLDSAVRVVVMRRAPLTGTYTECAPLVSSLAITAHGINIYQDLPAMFYNSYVPFHYGMPLNTPEDIGPMMVVFNLYPGSYQPSGHINVSRAREFYLNYTPVAGGFSPNKTGQMYVVASAINFLLISDGSAVLRYST